ncbi:MAG TPA: hypothetical protein VIK60_13985 [Vicinamibacterales bacterium]
MMLDARTGELNESGATIEAALATATFEALSGRHAGLHASSTTR